MKVMCQSFWDSVRTMLTEKFIALLDYIRKEERMKTNDISIIKNLGNKGKLNLTEKEKYERKTS